MDKFKIENYEREHGAGTFVPFRHLGDEEANYVKEGLRMRLNLPEGLPSGEILRAIQDRSTLLPGVDADADEFNLRHVLDNLGFEVSEFTYLNWRRFDDIDEVKSSYLPPIFSDVWYPSADDLDLLRLAQ